MLPRMLPRVRGSAAAVVAFTTWSPFVIALAVLRLLLGMTTLVVVLRR
jgi:hypothetical protein